MFTTKARRGDREINASSMADIAFLLLIFFLVTTTIASEQGLALRLPPLSQTPPLPMNERNVLNILLNSRNELLVDGQPMALPQLTSAVKEFVLNPLQVSYLAESPSRAVVSLKADRGTQYAAYIAVLDAVKQTYHELRAADLGISLADYQKTYLLRPEKLSPQQQKILEQLQARLPMQLSEAEPSQGGQ
ncbi:MAG: biopolymer transporter ExbD [Bernardetiaceae bacterium]|jgi:biopolymer transport protein ExbD|nr:biopolymer transporter ExbD [Bernardetiaceae bacterium]